jgi:SAM-dependent methyltransferase
MDRLEIFPRMAGARVLHFAPEPHLLKRISALGPAEYVKGDLYPGSPDIQKMDILALPFADDSLDFILANHVLEHVHDDRRALDEIFRVLRPGGMAILQTPFSNCLEATWEDAGIASDMARLQAYGQEDHVRLYGRDVVERFTQSGLRSSCAEHVSVMPDIDGLEQGLNPCEPFFLFEKPAAVGQQAPCRNAAAAKGIDSKDD